MNQNLFLAPAVMSACNEARTNYMDILVRQKSASQPVDWLGRMMDQSRSRLDSCWQVALSSATAGNVQDGIALLACIIREWGQYRAFKDLIDADAQGVNLDPTNLAIADDLRHDFQRAVGNEVTALATELTNAWLAGKVQREQNGKNDLMQEYTALHQIAMQVLQQRESSLQAAHQMNQQYADIALKGTEQARQCVYWMSEGVVHMYEFVKDTQANVVGMQQAFQGHLEQNLPAYINKANQERSMRVLGYSLGIILFLGALFAAAIFIGTHLVGH